VIRIEVDEGSMEANVSIVEGLSTYQKEVNLRM